MREGIHPDYPAAEITCACGNTFVTRSTRGDFQVDVCSACHPFYTGTQKLLDTAGRVDRFRKRYQTKSTTGARPAAPTRAVDTSASASTTSASTTPEPAT
jgi:large subunit ribosomal protein L31